MFDFESVQAGSGPLSIRYYLSSQVSIVTDVTGDARNVATVTIYNSTVAVYSGTMMQASPTLETPNDLILGTISIKAGAKFSMIVPSTQANGSVTLSCDLKSGDNPFTPFTAQIATWPMSS
ncbi:MAG: hypothetical protein ACTSV1_04455 [Alphaproteobacteria bacterium]